MRQKTSIEIFNYWNRIRASARAPLRAQIDPGSIRHILPQIFILELTENGEIRFRLAGTMICNFFGRELRDETFASLWTGTQTADVLKIAEGVMSHAMPTLLNATGYTSSGRSASFEVVMLPMRSSSDRCDRLLGCLVPAGNGAWLAGEPLAGFALDRSRLLHDWPTDADMLPLETKAPKSVLVSKGSEFTTVVRRVLHLRVFERGGAG